jgi:nitroreductase
MAVFLRSAHTDVDPLFLERWSPRAFDRSLMPEQDLITLFDAARWAPSAFNAQPWRFLYAQRDHKDWERFLGLLLPFNAAWVASASALIFILSDSLFQPPGADAPKPSLSHSFDAGAAWAQLALQATRLGYHTHGMTGLDFTKARETLRIPERFRIEAAAAVGRRADPATLPESLRSRETPSDRRPIAEIAFEGHFPVEIESEPSSVEPAHK